MTARTPTYLKGRFEQGDIPQGTDYEDLMDSYVNVVTSAEQSIDSNLRTTKQLIADSVSANSINIAAAAISIVSADTINVSGKVIFGSFDVSALSTTQASAIVLNGTTNFIIFADGNNTALRLPTSERGREQKIINAASTTLKIFPSVW